MTRGWWKRSWRPAVAQRLRWATSRGATGSVRGRIASLRAADNAAPRKRPPKSGARLFLDKRRERRRGFVRSWRGAVKRCSTWGRIAERRSGAALRMASGLTLRHIAEAVIAARAAGSGVERFSGARIVKSVADVGEKHLAFVNRGEPRGEPRERGEPRGEPSERGVERRAAHSNDTEGRLALLEKGAESERVNNQTWSRSILGPAARLGINPTEGVLDGVLSSALNKPGERLSWRGGGDGLGSSQGGAGAAPAKAGVGAPA